MLFFCKPSAARKPTRDRGIPRSRNLEPPDREISNPQIDKSRTHGFARQGQQGGHDQKRRDRDVQRVPARADQEISRSRNPQIEKSRMKRRLARGEENRKARECQHDLDRDIPSWRRPVDLEGRGTRRTGVDSRRGHHGFTATTRQVAGRYTTGHARRLHSTGATQDTGEQA